NDADRHAPPEQPDRARSLFSARLVLFSPSTSAATTMREKWDNRWGDSYKDRQGLRNVCCSPWLPCTIPLVCRLPPNIEWSSRMLKMCTGVAQRDTYRHPIHLNSSARANAHALSYTSPPSPTSPLPPPTALPGSIASPVLPRYLISPSPLPANAPARAPPLSSYAAQLRASLSSSTPTSPPPTSTPCPHGIAGAPQLAPAPSQLPTNAPRALPLRPRYTSTRAHETPRAPGDTYIRC
ncbi:hypothetical protein HWV62_5095, partial [Athelia sp. TMB]